MIGFPAFRRYYAKLLVVAIVLAVLGGAIVVAPLPGGVSLAQALFRGLPEQAYR